MASIDRETRWSVASPLPRVSGRSATHQGVHSPGRHRAVFLTKVRHRLLTGSYVTPERRARDRRGICAGVVRAATWRPATRDRVERRAPPTHSADAGRPAASELATLSDRRVGGWVEVGTVRACPQSPNFRSDALGGCEGRPAGQESGHRRQAPGGLLEGRRVAGLFGRCCGLLTRRTPLGVRVSSRSYSPGSAWTVRSGDPRTATEGQ